MPKKKSKHVDDKVMLAAMGKCLDTLETVLRGLMGFPIDVATAMLDGMPTLYGLVELQEEDLASGRPGWRTADGDAERQIITIYSYDGVYWGYYVHTGMSWGVLKKAGFAEDLAWRSGMMNNGQATGL